MGKPFNKAQNKPNYKLTIRNLPLSQIYMKKVKKGNPKNQKFISNPNCLAQLPPPPKQTLATAAAVVASIWFSRVCVFLFPLDTVGKRLPIFYLVNL